MNHYILTGYETQHYNTRPSVKIYGIYNTLLSAIDEMANYTHKNIEFNNQYFYLSPETVRCAVLICSSNLTNYFW